MKTLMILIKIFIIGALLIISNENLALQNPTNRERLVEEYTAWLSQLFDNWTVVIGYVISNEWLPNAEQNVSAG